MSARSTAPGCPKSGAARLAAAAAGTVLATALLRGPAAFVPTSADNHALRGLTRTSVGSAVVEPLLQASSSAMDPMGASMPAAGVAAAVGCIGAGAVGLAAGRRTPTNQRAAKANAVACRAGDVIETFLLKGPVTESNLNMKCSPLAWHMDLTGIVFFSLGVKPELIAAVAGGGLGLHGVCPVYIADCYGIVGWDDASKSNVELMEKGCGQEFGKVGGAGGEGVVVVAFRGDGHKPTTPDGSGGLAGAGLHMLVTGGDVPAPSTAGAIYGGVAKGCYKLEHSGDLVRVQQFAVSSPGAVVTSFEGDATEAATAALAKAGAKPAAAGYFPCFCRGINKYGKDGVEPEAFAAAGLDGTRLFGMFAQGEFGPPQGEPMACQVDGAKPMEVSKGSMISVLSLYSK